MEVWKVILEQAIYPAFVAGLSTLTAWIIAHGVSLLKAKVKESAHFRGSAVVIDSIFEAIHELGEEIQKALADGKLSEAEKVKIKELARKLAREKLVNLSGFYKKELDKWIDEQIKIGLGKILARVL